MEEVEFSKRELVKDFLSEDESSSSSDSSSSSSSSDDSDSDSGDLSFEKLSLAEVQTPDPQDEDLVGGVFDWLSSKFKGDDDDDEEEDPALKNKTVVQKGDGESSKSSDVMEIDDDDDNGPVVFTNVKKSATIVKKPEAPQVAKSSDKFISDRVKKLLEVHDIDYDDFEEVVKSLPKPTPSVPQKKVEVVEIVEDEPPVKIVKVEQPIKEEKPVKKEQRVKKEILIKDDEEELPIDPRSAEAKGKKKVLNETAEIQAPVINPSSLTQEEFNRRVQMETDRRVQMEIDRRMAEFLTSNAKLEEIPMTPKAIPHSRPSSSKTSSAASVGQLSNLFKSAQSATIKESAKLKKQLADDDDEEEEVKKPMSAPAPVPQKKPPKIKDPDVVNFSDSDEEMEPVRKSTIQPPPQPAAAKKDPSKPSEASIFLSKTPKEREFERLIPDHSVTVNLSSLVRRKDPTKTNLPLIPPTAPSVKALEDPANKGTFDPPLKRKPSIEAPNAPETKKMSLMGLFKKTEPVSVPKVDAVEAMDTTTTTDESKAVTPTDSQEAEPEGDDIEDEPMPIKKTGYSPERAYAPTVVLNEQPSEGVVQLGLGFSQSSTLTNDTDEILSGLKFILPTVLKGKSEKKARYILDAVVGDVDFEDISSLFSLFKKTLTDDDTIDPSKVMFSFLEKSIKGFENSGTEKLLSTEGEISILRDTNGRDVVSVIFAGYELMIRYSRILLARQNLGLLALDMPSLSERSATYFKDEDFEQLTACVNALSELISKEITQELSPDVTELNSLMFPLRLSEASALTTNFTVSKASSMNTTGLFVENENLTFIVQ